MHSTAYGTALSSYEQKSPICVCKQTGADLFDAKHWQQQLHMRCPKCSMIHTAQHHPHLICIQHGRVKLVSQSWDIPIKLVLPKPDPDCDVTMHRCLDCKAR